MSVTRSVSFEIVIRSKAEDGQESERVMSFDTSERQPSYDEALAVAENVKAEESAKAGFIGVMFRRTVEVTVFDQISAKSATIISNKSVQTTLL